MAVRPVYMSCVEPPYFKIYQAEFSWNGGFAVSQKQKNIIAIHSAFNRRFPDLKILEISSKSMQLGGKELSAFSLLKYVPPLGKSVTVENVFQSSKIFENGGPFIDLLTASPREAKSDERLKSSGKLIGFRFNGSDFPIEPKTIFYDYIYMNALLENEALAQVVLSYDAFTDIEFNPNRSINCQAKAAALFVSLSRVGLQEKVRDFQTYQSIFLRKR